MTDADWPALCAYDATAFGAERGAVLAGLRGRLPRPELVAERAGRIAGFILGRDGMLAGHLCPLIADDDVIACALSRARSMHSTGRSSSISRTTRPPFEAFWKRAALLRVRPFTRMLHGTPARFDAPARTFAVVGPEFG